MKRHRNYGFAKRATPIADGLNLWPCEACNSNNPAMVGEPMPMKCSSCGSLFVEHEMTPRAAKEMAKTRRVASRKKGWQ